MTKLSVKQQFVLRQIAGGEGRWLYADDWHASVVQALARRGLVETRVLADGGWSAHMVRATGAGLEIGRGLEA